MGKKVKLKKIKTQILEYLFCEIKIKMSITLKEIKKSLKTNQKNNSQKLSNNIQKVRQHRLSSSSTNLVPTIYSGVTQQQKSDLNMNNTQQPLKELEINNICYFQKKPNTNKNTSQQCKHWNQSKQKYGAACKFNHFTLKHIQQKKNPTLESIRNNHIIDDQQLIILEITEIKYVNINQIQQIMTKELDEETKVCNIKIAITNKRLTQQLISQIKKGVKYVTDDIQQQREDWKEIIKNLDTVKNNIKTWKNQINLKNPKDFPHIQFEDNLIKKYNQLNNKQKNKSQKTMQTKENDEEVKSQNQQQAEPLLAITQPIQRQGQTMMDGSKYEYNTQETQKLLREQENKNNPRELLLNHVEDFYTYLIEPNSLTKKIEMAQDFELNDEQRIYQRGDQSGISYGNKLIIGYKTQYQQRNQFITIDISRQIASQLYFQNQQAKLEDSYLMPQIHQSIQKCSTIIWKELMRGASNQELILSPKNHEQEKKREILKQIAIEFDKKQVIGEDTDEILLLAVFRIIQEK